ncbi:uncharacterized protein LOC118794546 [Megalops cyprinoides]|uniref:uncharacterized protein LOC118794546 n=1 Tax=Megalops cyprinoides TaxID=118141 RepID=UPI0018655437|nr:uncharacterized protein LOC118794546 [Megalops cyprinoides]
MVLLDYPIPELEVTLQETGRVLRLTLGPEKYSQYESTLFQQKEALQDAHRRLATAASGSENWVTEQFKNRLLRCADPLSTSTAIPAVLPPSRAKRDGGQVERAAALLWAVAKLYSEPQLVEGDEPTERTQQSEVFAASRLPGKTQDQIKVRFGPLGGIFPVQILCRPCPGGPLSPLPFHEIHSQVAEVASQPRAGQEQDPATICGFSALHRHTWHALREQILKEGGAAAASLALMESAVLAVSLEDCHPPPDLAETLNAVVNLVVFQDSTAGMVFEHCALDGMVAGLVTESVWRLSESLNISMCKPQASPTGSLKNASPSSLKPLSFPLGGITKPNPAASGLSTQATHPIITFEISSYPDIFTTLRGHRGLFDAWVNFSLQLALKQTLGDSAAGHILVTPTHMRHYKHGRCDPTYSLTTRSRQLVEALMSCSNASNAPRYTKELLRLFHLAFLEHKHLIKTTKSGQGVGPHLAALRWALAPDNPLRKFLDPFGCPTIYITGKDLMEGVECAVGNVYARDQLAVTYLGRRDRVRLVLNGKGSFAGLLGQLQETLTATLKIVMLLALRYAIAGQMGALECLLQDVEVAKENGKGNQRTTPSDSAQNSDFTLVIHGGAGEDMMLNQKVIDVVEFSLQTALSLGAQELASGGNSVDAVQKCVAALEDCFLFNAGKGSVYNREGKHEMEATIVDGTVMNSGSVACVRSVKNPVKAARKVMEKSDHTLLTGDGAEEFLEGLEEKDKPVDAEYFHTNVRLKELEIKQSKGKASKNNHPQTVGAIALDRWGRLAAATSTGGLVGKWKGRVGDTAIVGAGIYADKQLAVTCSGDGDVFLRHTVAHKVASLYHHKGYSLREACWEVLSENLDGTCAGIIAVDAKGEAVIETNAGVMFTASMIGGIAHAQVLRPMKNPPYVVWETEKLVAYLHSDPWTPGATILTQKTHSGPFSIFHLPEHDYLALLLGAREVASLLCERLGVLRCALVFKPHPEQPATIRVLPLHGLEPNWRPHLAEEEDFQPHDLGYCTSKSGPRWEDAELEKIQARIRAQLPSPKAPPNYAFLGDSSHDSLFSRIVQGEEKQWRVWEDNNHVAFLTPYPNTPGLTVLVPRRPLSSDIFSLEESDYRALALATRKVAQLLEEGMGVRGVALIFEGFEVDYAHAKLIPLHPPPGNSPTTPPLQFFPTYCGYVSSADGPPASPESLSEMHTKITHCRPPRSWENPQEHASLAIKSQWYRNLFQVQNTLFHETVEFFHSTCKYAYALTPLTTDTISSPMGLGSDSEPVFVNMLGQDVYLADSMQFVLEYFLRFQEDLPGAYYVSPSFRGENPDATHLNQFYHVECELLGDMDAAISVAEGYVTHLTRAMLKRHSDIILKSAGTLCHIQDLLKKLDGQTPLPRVTLEEAIPMMPSEDCLEWVQDGEPHFGRKLTRKGERVLIERYGGAVWLMEMDHLGVPFYQAYVEGSGKRKAKAADLLLGLGETIGLGERHSTAEMVQESLKHHAVPEDSYKWYINMREIKPLLTSGWGMGTERFLCWLLQHNDVRDMHIIPRMKAKKYMP